MTTKTAATKTAAASSTNRGSDRRDQLPDPRPESPDDARGGGPTRRAGPRRVLDS